MYLILRQTIHEAHWERQLAEIIDVCKAHGINEVMLMEQSHQIVMVPFPLKKHERMARIYHEIASTLRKNGIEYSVNLATIVGHSDAPVPEDQRLPFTRFVGDDQLTAKAVYCISDPEWVKYAQDVVSLYAQTHPKRLMIDDDFRSLNHTAQYGCFCENHAHKVSEACHLPELHTHGLVEAILGNHPDEAFIKQTWQSLNFEMQVNAAEKIENAIHSIDATIQIGLMNSGEPAHSLQGRDMSILLETFAKKGNIALSRPAGGVYADGLHTQIINMHQMPALSYHAVTVPTYWVSEIENWPHSRYIKSIAITKLQMKMHALWGADALTLNVYDYLATPLPLEPEWGKLLSDVNKELDIIVHHRKDKELVGVSLPWKYNEAASIQNKHHRFEDLLPLRNLDTLLPLLGIPVQFKEGNVSVLLGDQVLAYTDSELHQFLTKSLFLDDKAAQHFIDRGFQTDLGVTLHDTLEIPSVERLTHPDFSKDFYLSDLPTNWFRMELQGDTMHRMELHSGAVAISHFVDDQQNIISPALSLFTNEKGGRVCVMAQRVQDLSWLHRGRSIQLQALFALLDERLKPQWMIQDHPNCAPFVYQNPKTLEMMWVAVNTGLDTEYLELPHPQAELILGTLQDSKVVLNPLDFVLLTWKE